MTATPPAPKPSAPSKPLPKWQQAIIEGLWKNEIKPRLTAAFVTAKAKLLDALQGKPLLMIGSVVGAIDLFLLKGPKPRSTKSTQFLTDARKFLGDVQLKIDQILAPPKPISASLRKVLAGVVTVAGLLGVYQAGKAATKP